MDKKSDLERRAHPRFPYVLQISYPTDATRVGDFTEDLSEAGLFIRTDRVFPVGERVKLNISFSPLMEPLHVEVEVVRVRPASKDQPAGVAVKIPEDRAQDRDQLARLTRRDPDPVQEGTASIIYRVLIAEDNALVGQMFGDALQNLMPRKGVTIEVELARDGDEALARLGRSPPINLLITDRFMAPMDGFTLLTRLRSQAQFKDLPIVMISSSNPEVSRQALALGANVYLAKPVNFLHIVKTVQTLLAGKLAATR